MTDLSAKLSLFALAVVAPPLLLPQLLPWWTLPCCLAIGVALEFDNGFLSRDYRWSRIDCWLLLFLLFVAIGFTVSPAPDLTRPKASGVLFGVITMRAFVRTVTSRRLVAIVLMSCSAVGVVAILSGAFIVNQAIGLTANTLGQEALLRAKFIPRGTALSPNALAIAILLVTPILSAQVFAGTSIRILFGKYRTADLLARLGLGSVCLAALVLLLLTKSFNGVASLMVLALVVALAVRASKLQSRALSMITISIAGGWILSASFLVLDQSLRESLLPCEQTSLCESLETRNELWRRGGSALLHFPVTGVGLGTTSRVLEVIYPLLRSNSATSAHVHNQWLQTGLDVGIPGLIAYLAFQLELLAIGFYCMGIARQWQLAVAIGLMASVGSVHVVGVVDALALGAKLGWFPWASAGMLICLSRVIETESGA